MNTTKPITFKLLEHASRNLFLKTPNFECYHKNIYGLECSEKMELLFFGDDIWFLLCFNHAELVGRDKTHSPSRYCITTKDLFALKLLCR